MELTDIIFWGLFWSLAAVQTVIIVIFRLPKDNNIRNWVEPAFIAVLIAAFLRLFVVQAFIIPSSSMEGTLLIGDQIMAEKMSSLPGKGKKFLKFASPKRGEVILFKYPEDPKLMFIKRCVGLPGDIVMVRGKQLYINGKKMEEPYISHIDKRVYGFKESNRDNYGPVTVAPGNYFMMGDNRDASEDSRFWGFVPEENLRGKAWIVYWPPKRWKVVRHYNIKS